MVTSTCHPGPSKQELYNHFSFICLGDKSCASKINRCAGTGIPYVFIQEIGGLMGFCPLGPLSLHV